jgi:regulator of replication initiation timing
MLKKAGKSIEYLTIEQRDNLIVALTQKVARVTERNGELEMENLALRKQVLVLEKRAESPEKLKSQSAEKQLCECGETALMHRTYGGIGGVLGSCMRASCDCKKFKAKA